MESTLICRFYDIALWLQERMPNRSIKSTTPVLILPRVSVCCGPGSNMRFEEMLTHVREYLEFRCGDTNLRRRVVSYYSRCFRLSGTMHDEMRLLDFLPGDMHSELLKTIAIEAQRKVHTCLHYRASPHADSAHPSMRAEMQKAGILRRPCASQMRTCMSAVLTFSSSRL